MTRLSDNVNRIALLRNTRDIGIPDEIGSAKTAVEKPPANKAPAFSVTAINLLTTHSEISQTNTKLLERVNSYAQSYSCLSPSLRAELGLPNFETNHRLIEALSSQSKKWTSRSRTLSAIQSQPIESHLFVFFQRSEGDF